MWTDQTWLFLKKLSRGNQYVMMMAESNSNAILVEPMKNRTSQEIIRGYQVLIDQLNEADIFPTEHILDNEKSAEFLEVIKKNRMTYQLVPPHDHQRNQAEKAIQTFKDHVAPTKTSHYICGIEYYHKPNTR